MVNSCLPHAEHPTDRLLGTALPIVALRAQIRHLVNFDTIGTPHARELCQQLGDAQQHFSVLVGLWGFYHVRDQLPQARDMGEQLPALAHRQRDPALLVPAHRIKGELLLAQSRNHHAAAHACFQQALAVARRQQAKSWELRAAISLSRLWQCRGKRVEARQLLGEAYGWFTEGFGTVDLQEAGAVLAALA